MFSCPDDGGPDVWIKDDGATAHMTNSAEYYQTFRKFDKPVEIIVGNKQTIPAYGCGTIAMRARVGTIAKSIELSNVLYAPDVGKNLLSASQAMKRGISNLGDADDMVCRFFRKETPDNILLEAHCSSNGLFVLRANPLKPQGGSAASAYFVNKEKTTSCPEAALTMTTKLPLSLWHRRLGHQGVEYVKQYKKDEVRSANVVIKEQWIDHIPDETDQQEATDLNEDESAQPMKIRRAIGFNDDVWRRAMDDEMASHDKHGTWQLVGPSKRRKILNERYKKNTHPDGLIERFRVRLVAKGYTHIAGIDNQDRKAMKLRGEASCRRPCRARLRRRSSWRQMTLRKP